MRRRNHGFTLIELITIVSILAILSSIALPSMHGLIEHQRTSATINALLTHIQMTRMAAITHNQRAVLCPSRDGQQCTERSDWSHGWLLFLDANGDRQRDANDEILRADITPDSRKLRVFSSIGRRQLRYLPNGSSAGSNLTLSICNPEGELLGKVIVNNMGRPRSERPRKSSRCPG